MHYQYQTEGTCSAMIEFDLDNNIIHNVNFLGGCNGNLQGISKLVEGLPAEQVISRLEGIRCEWKDTSCPDQLTRALKQALARQ